MPMVGFARGARAKTAKLNRGCGVSLVTILFAG